MLYPSQVTELLVRQALSHKSLVITIDHYFITLVAITEGDLYIRSSEEGVPKGYPPHLSFSKFSLVLKRILDTVRG